MHTIAVIGCGAIGLTSALAIQNIVPEADVTILAKAFTPDTTSDVAAGLWEPFLVQNTPPEKIHRWAKTTYDYVLGLWRQGKAREAGICLQPAVWITDTPDYSPPSWMNIPIGSHEISQEQLTKLNSQYNQKATGGVSFLTFTWEGSIFLPYLQKEFLGKGGRIVRRDVKYFEELRGRYDVIVNCTGLEARKLTNDDKVEPFRGQIIKVKAPAIFHSTLIDTKDICYVIPNMHGVILGGTAQQDYNLRVDIKDAKDILRKCSVVEPAVKSAEIIKHQVGLRPGRDKVRLEVEIKGGEKDGALKIVHNYGHGGAGITLSVGCAFEAAMMVRSLLEEKNKETECKL